MRLIIVHNLTKELFEKIEKIVIKKRNEGYGHIYMPNKKSFENTQTPISNKIIISVNSQKSELNTILASKILKDLENINIKFDWKLTRGPGIRLTFKGDKVSMEEKLFKNIISKPRRDGCGVIGTLHGMKEVYGASFHLDCQNHVYDKLKDEILNDIKNEGYDFEISYYYIG
ncbi:hypothetical protein [Methanobrevibacter sp.]|uniref:hypothetical protein n=1 Tax=Methanobrevibacter sp. TaxID=66852 RepID=UPI0038698B52